MPNLHIERLYIEITRKCNMSCRHCMRGDAQDISITQDLLTKTFQNITSICELGFTGGEPTLNVPAIRQALNICKRNHIRVDSFYIVTNAKILPKAFLNVCLDWYLYCQQWDPFLNAEFSGVAISRDQFHEPIPPEHFDMLKAFSFYRPHDKDFHWDDHQLLDEGRARNITHIQTRPNVDYKPFQPDSDRSLSIDKTPDGTIEYLENILYISADGTVKLNCDDAYDNMQNRIGTLQNETLYDMVHRLYMWYQNLHTA